MLPISQPTQSTQPTQPDLEPPGTVRLPGALDRLAMRISHWPWWAIALAIGLVLSFYGILTTPTYQQALAFVTDDPTLSTTDFLRVTYRVNQDGQLQVVSGVLTAQDSQTLTIRTDDGTMVKVPRANVDLNAIQQSGAQITLHIPAQTISGAFYTETDTQYQIEQADGSIISVNKLDVADSLHLSPADCTADTHGSCHMTATIPASQVSGILLSADPIQYVVQTAPPVFTTVLRSTIHDVISENPGQCALNNLGSCRTGIFLTLYLTLTAYAIALVIGLILALMRISSQPFFRNAAILYIEIVRGIPILVILLIFYFAFGPWIRDNLHIPMPDSSRAIMGLAVAYGAFLAEIFRAGIQSIHRGQMEAARSLGMTYFQAMRYVILPQAIRVVLPPLGNDFIAMLKDTSLVAAISLSELTYLSTQFESHYLLTFEPFLTIAALYLIMTLVLSLFVRAIEHRSRLPG